MTGILPTYRMSSSPSITQAMTQTMTQEILPIRPFPQPQQPIECMLLPLQTLFRHQRYPMDTPQRLHSYMITLFTRGSGRHIVDFASYPYREKTMLFVAENQVHQWEIHPDNDAYVLAFSKEFLYRSGQDRDILETYRIFDFTLQSPILSLADDDYRRFLTLFGELQTEFSLEAADAFKQEIYRNLLRTILLLAERIKQQEAPPVAITPYREFTRFRERVESDFPRTRNVQDYATALGYSPKKLNQITQQVLSKNAKLFVDERVILEIKRLLIHTDLSIKEIADQTGFDEPTNLIKFFKRYTGQTPLAFRDALARV